MTAPAQKFELAMGNVICILFIVINLLHIETAFAQLLHSSPIVLDEAARVVWTVNPDNDSLSRIHADNLYKIEEILVCNRPESIAIDLHSRAWVVCRDDDQVQVINTSGKMIRNFRLPFGSRPVSIVFDAGGINGYIALEGRNRIAWVKADDLELVGELPEQNGVNFEFYDTFSTIMPIASVDGLAAKNFARRYVGTYQGAVTEEFRLNFGDEFISPNPAFPLLVQSTYGFVFRGYISIPQTGDYTFYLSVEQNDGADLWINGTQIVDNDSNTGAMRERSGTVNLSAGRHPFKIRYFDGGAAQKLSFEYQGPGIARKAVPPDTLYPEQELRKPRALAVRADGLKLLSSQFISDDNAARVASFDIAAQRWEQPINIWEHVKDNSPQARGVPNYVLALAFRPNINEAWYGGKKDNFFNGSFHSNTLPTFENTIRGVLGPIDINSGKEPLNAFNYMRRIDADNHALVSAISFDSAGSMLFATFLAGNEIIVYDPDSGLELDRSKVGLSPTGIVVDSTTNRIFVKNFLSRDVSVFNGSELIQNGIRSLADSQIAVISTVSTEALTASVLRGKKIFYSSKEIDPGLENINPSRMARDGYFSCATCHLDGGHDGRTWDFTNRGEGLRNTTSLRGRSGTKHGNVHWTANFDEIQDFELDIVNAFGGTGFTAASGGPHPSLQTKNGGRDSDLDALAGYVATLGLESLPKSPYRSASGTKTSEAAQGAAVFQRLGCGSCHDPAKEFTDSTLGSSATLHDVGTIKSSSGLRLGGALPGIDTPTLLGLHAAAPYLHDGSAPTLRTVFEQFDSGAAPGTPARAHDLSSLLIQEYRELMSYLLQLDAAVPKTDSVGPSAPGNLRRR